MAVMRMFKSIAYRPPYVEVRELRPELIRPVRRRPVRRAQPPPVARRGPVGGENLVMLGGATAGALVIATMPVIPAVSLVACIAGVLCALREAL